ncbi:MULTISPECIES: hypothetical protein [unclassified Streptomyces]
MATSADTDLTEVPAEPIAPAVTLAKWWATPSRRRTHPVQAYV